MRKMIAAFKVSLDLKFQGPGDYADWVPAWSEDYDLGDNIDTCLLGGRMYRGYEKYWSAMMAAPTSASPMTGTIPTAGELLWADRIPSLPHFVLSHDLSETAWQNTQFLRSIEDVVNLKAMPGSDIYLMGGGALFRHLVNAGLVDELRLISYPVVAGGSNDLFKASGPRQELEVIRSKPMTLGLVRTDYRLLGAA